MPPRPRRPRLSRHFKIDHELGPAESDEYHALLRDPRTTVDSAHAWLLGRGHRGISRSAVARHKCHFLRTLAEQRQATDTAERFARLASSGELPPAALVSGAAARAEQLLFEALLACRSAGEGGGQAVSHHELQRLGKTVFEMVRTRRALTDLEDLLAAAAAARRDGAADDATDRVDPPHPRRLDALKRQVYEILGQPCPSPAPHPQPAPPAPEKPSDPMEVNPDRGATPRGNV